TGPRAVVDHDTMMEQELRRRFLVVLGLTMPVLILSPPIQSWAGFRLPDLLGLNLVLVVLASIIVLYGGVPFYRGAATALRARTADMERPREPRGPLGLPVQRGRDLPIRGSGLLLGGLDPRALPPLRTLDGDALRPRGLRS